MTKSASAGFDVLSIADRLTRSEGGAAPAEIHVFSYLACLMSLYDGRYPDQWSYGFAATPAGAPFAVAIADESDRLRAAGRLLLRQDVLILSEQGIREVSALRSFPSLASRGRYLEASCAAATLLPLPSVADALSFEPQLQRALDAPSTRELLKPAGVALVDQQFRALSETLRQRFPETSDLLVATTVWLSYLASEGRASEPPT